MNPTALRLCDSFDTVPTLESERLAGEWEVVLCLRAGRDGTWSKHLTLRSDTFSADHGAPGSGRIVLQHDPGKEPAIDFVYSLESRRCRGDRIEGIYRHTGEVLVLHLGLGATEEVHYDRPQSFTPTTESTLLVLVRKEELVVRALSRRAHAALPQVSQPVAPNGDLRSDPWRFLIATRSPGD